MENNDAINPMHYRDGFRFTQCECIDLTRELPFSIGNAIKYVWRAGMKDDAEQDLEKAKWYIDDERCRRRMTSQQRDAAENILRMISTDNLTEIQRMKLSIFFHVISGLLSASMGMIDELKTKLKEQR